MNAGFFAPILQVAHRTCASRSLNQLSKLDAGGRGESVTEAAEASMGNVTWVTKIRAREDVATASGWRKGEVGEGNARLAGWLHLHLCHRAENVSDF